MTGKHVLENEKAKVVINAKGAELSSFCLKEDGTEYIWQGDPNYWGRHAPILFPIVGRLKENSYLLDGKSYSLTQHGFARDLPFTLVSATSHQCSFKLTENEDTLTKYPYKFELFVNYTLEETTLTVEHVVVNTNLGEMYFSTGAHPGFNWPLVPAKEQAEDYVIEFSQAETLKRLKVDPKRGLITKEKVPFLANETSFSLNSDLFRQDAIVLHDFASSDVTLRSTKTGKFVQMDISDYPYLGIWSQAGGAPFVCLEPWFGIADSVDTDQNFKTKRGIQKLEAGKRFSCKHQITIG